jgi:hypothetical protein
MNATLIVHGFWCNTAQKLPSYRFDHLERAVAKRWTKFHITATFAGNMKNRTAWHSDFQHFLETQRLSAELNIIAEFLEVGGFGVLVFLAFTAFVLDRVRGFICQEFDNIGASDKLEFVAV